MSALFTLDRLGKPSTDAPKEKPKATKPPPPPASKPEPETKPEQSSDVVELEDSDVSEEKSG